MAIDPRRAFRRLRNAWHCRIADEITERIVRMDTIPPVGPIPFGTLSNLMSRVGLLDDAIDRIDMLEPDSIGYARKVRSIIKRVRAMDSDTAFLLDDVNARLMRN